MHIVECDADVTLVSTLTSIPMRRVYHANGKHGVLRRLIKKDVNSIGMIDQDPLRLQPKKFLQRFSEIQYSAEDKLRVLSHNRRNNRLIILCPRLEEWIIEASKRDHLTMSSYNLPSNADRLHEIINFRLNRFKELVEELMQRSNRVRALQTRLTERI